MRFLPHCWLALLLLMGCASPAPNRSAARSPSAVEISAAADRAGMAFDDITQAAAIYNLKCARCHRFYDPTDYGGAAWNSWMTKMSRKARLQPDQAQLLARYLEAFRQANPDLPKQNDPSR